MKTFIASILIFLMIPLTGNARPLGDPGERRGGLVLSGKVAARIEYQLHYNAAVASLSLSQQSNGDLKAVLSGQKTTSGRAPAKGKSQIGKNSLWIVTILAP